MNRRAFGFLVSGFALGCTKNNRPQFDDPSFDQKQARETLVMALEAWKRSRTNDLALRQPPIRFSDDDARSGFRLVKYEIVEPVALGPFKDVAVRLELRSRDGKTVLREATYQVAIKPVVSVHRSDT